MSRITEKLNQMNLEQKLFCFVISIIPIFVSVTILYLIFQSLSSRFWEFLIPTPKTSIDFSMSHSGTHPFLVGYFLLSALSIGLATLSAIYKRHLMSLIFLFIPLFLIAFRTIYIYKLNQEGTGKPIAGFVYSIDLLDLGFFSVVSFLLIWQISIIYRQGSKQRLKLL